MELIDYVNEYLKNEETGIHDGVSDLVDYSREELNRLESKNLMLSIAEQIKNTLTAPIGNELLTRYQTSTDNELYRAIEALRKQQAWRSRAMLSVKSEAA